MGRLRKILLVEDEDNIALALEYLMRAEGHRVSRISSGADALASIEEIKPDLVLLDVMLPEVSGYDICQSVRQNPELSGVKIIMMTASGNRNESTKCLDLGANGFVPKPFAASELRSEVRRLLTSGT